MRFRSENNYSTSPDKFEVGTDLNCTSLTTKTKMASITQGTYREMWDEVVPNFNARRKAGEVFFNSLQSVHSAQSVVDGGGNMLRNKTKSCSSPVKYATYTTDGSTAAVARLSPYIDSNGLLVITSNPLDANEIANAKTEASTSALAGVGRGNSNFYESIAERKQVYDLLRKPLNGLVKTSNSLKVATSVQMASSQWLKYRYGIMPLVSDMGSILDTYIERKHPRTRSTERGFASLTSQYQSGTTIQAGVTRYPLSYNCTLLYSVRSTVLWDTTVPLLTNSGLGFKERVTVPWELVPYSFVADWFVNVGDYLSANTPAPFSKILGSCLMETFDYQARLTIGSPTNTSAAWDHLSISGTGTVARQRLVRTRGPLSSPGIVVRSSFGFERDTRFFDALALVTQRFSKAFLYRG